MATYGDMTPYDYTPGAPGMVNVGWLGRTSRFETGQIAKSAWKELLRFAGQPVNLMRGLHDCELCDLESPVRIPSPYSDRGFVSLGTGEIHVRGASGLIMVAPTLILHYVESHNYLPPAEFVAALLVGPDA